MTVHTIFQQLDRIVRMRPDAQRWRVTITDDRVEIWRRPILTSAITLAAIGVGDAPMPIPQLCYAVHGGDEQGATWHIRDHTQTPVQSFTASSVVHVRQHVSALLSAFSDDSTA